MVVVFLLYFQFTFDLKRMHFFDSGIGGFPALSSSNLEQAQDAFGLHKLPDERLLNILDVLQRPQKERIMRNVSC